MTKELENQDAIIAAACDVSKNAMDPLGDGDQSLLRAVFPSGHTPESTALHVLWSNLGDFSKDGKMNVFGIARAAYWGDAAYIEGAIAWVRAGCPANELFPYHSDLYGAPKRLGSLTELLEGRHTNLRMTPLHFAILGAKRPADAQASIPHDWLKCAAVLIKAGARVDSRDLMGNTPMMGALAVPVQNADTIAIALHLAKNGATGLDLNRLGMNTLMSAVEKQAIDVIHVLAEADCDPRQANHWGQSSLQLAQMMQKLEMGASAGAILQVLEAASERRAKKGKSSSLSGRAVALKGLSDSNLNGQKGTVSALVNATQGRYGVTLSGGRELAVKWQNLEPLAEGASKGDDLLGKLVVLQGLSTAALNGRRGTCQEWVEDAGRWVVALEDDGAAGGEAGKVVRVRPQNLRAVSVARCCTCGKQGAKLQRCSACFAVHFCNKTCHEGGWRAHKPACKATRAASIALVDTATRLAEFQGNLGHDGGDFSEMNEAPDASRGTHILVKVQVPLMQPDDSNPLSSAMMCYSKGKVLNCFISRENCARYAEVFAAVTSHGVGAVDGQGGIKAYFNAAVDSSKVLAINFELPQPPPQW